MGRILMQKQAKINHDILFTTSVFHTNFEAHKSKHTSLIAVINNTFRKKENTFKSNRGGWQSEIHTYNGGSFKPLIENIMQVCDKVKSILDLHVVNPKIKYWVNINKKYDYNTSHIHPNSILSGVYYLKVPENSGDIVFHHPSPYMHLIEHASVNQYNNGTYSYTPKEGDLFIFSPYLNHEVTQNLTEDEDDERISIAFNITTTF